MGFLPMEAELLPPSDDRIFKLILTAPEAGPVLTDLISAILGREVTDAVVRNNELPPEDAEEKAERLDVNCRTADGTQVDLEMQASRIQEFADGKHENLKCKSVYYLCDLHSSQSARGLRRYDALAQTWQVTFCSYTAFPERKGFLNSFSLRHDIDNGLFCGAIHVVFVELSKLRDILKKPVSKMTDLEKWALFFRYANETAQRKTVNEVIASKEVLQVAGNLLMSVSRNERERAVYRSRRMYETDRMSDLATAEDRGWDRGHREGRLEGHREGRLEGMVEVARNMLKANYPLGEVAKLTGLTEAALEELNATQPG